MYTFENYVSKEIFSSFSFLFVDMMALKSSRRMGIGGHQFHYIFLVKSINQCTSLCTAAVVGT